mmetsp:Transcript_8622/g.14608  ORF Transcript_8622/g.14608 Transcript_8622/m.14608 type:complete len:92 (+) Transcript_8622:406-681(+)
MLSISSHAGTATTDLGNNTHQDVCPNPIIIANGHAFVVSAATAKAAAMVTMAKLTIFEAFTIVHSFVSRIMSTSRKSLSRYCVSRTSLRAK